MNDGERAGKCPHGHGIVDYEEMGPDGKPTGFLIPVAMASDDLGPTGDPCPLCPNGRAGIPYRSGEEQGQVLPALSRGDLGKLEILEVVAGGLRVILSATCHSAADVEMLEHLARGMVGVVPIETKEGL